MKIIKGIYWFVMTVVTVINSVLAVITFAALFDDDIRKDIEKKVYENCEGIEIEDPDKEDELSDYEQFVFKKENKNERK